MGRADRSVVDEIVAAVGKAAPVSMALGELAADGGLAGGATAAGVSYVKLGLAGMAEEPDWPERRRRAVEPLGGVGVVAVVYADWPTARARRGPIACWSRPAPGLPSRIDRHVREIGRQPPKPLADRRLVGFCRPDSPASDAGRSGRLLDGDALGRVLSLRRTISRFAAPPAGAGVEALWTSNGFAGWCGKFFHDRQLTTATVNGILIASR